MPRTVAFSHRAGEILVSLSPASFATIARLSFGVAGDASRDARTLAGVIGSALRAAIAADSTAERFLS
jgi:hypothetical protein